jgi:hypothetical protein
MRCPLFLSHFNKNWNVSTKVTETFQHQISWKSVRQFSFFFSYVQTDSDFKRRSAGWRIRLERLRQICQNNFYFYMSNESKNIIKWFDTVQCDMFRSVNYHSQKAQKHVEETTITLVMVHQIESKFYIKILIKTNCFWVKIVKILKPLNFVSSCLFYQLETRECISVLRGSRRIFPFFTL